MTEPLLEPEPPLEPLLPEPEPVDPVLVPLLTPEPLPLEPLPLEPLLVLDPLELPLLEPLDEVPGLLLLEQATETALNEATTSKRLVRT